VGAVEERIAAVESSVGEHSLMISGIHQAIVSLERRMDQQFAGVDQRFTAVDQRFTALEQRLDQRFTALEQRLDQRFTAFDSKMSRQFQWIIGLQMTAFVAMIATLFSALLARP
jgi:hypothetical protein